MCVYKYFIRQSEDKEEKQRHELACVWWFIILYLSKTVLGLYGSNSPLCPLRFGTENHITAETLISTKSSEVLIILISQTNLSSKYNQASKSPLALLRVMLLSQATHICVRKLDFWPHFIIYKEGMWIILSYYSKDFLASLPVHSSHSVVVRECYHLGKNTLLIIIII